MKLFTNLFKKNLKQAPIQQQKAKAAETTSHLRELQVPQNHSIAMSKLGIDIQTVLLNVDTIEQKGIAERYASLISEKYGVNTKVSQTPDGSSYLVYVYRIDLALIEDLYDPTTNRWIFSLSNLINSEDFDIDGAIKSAEVGMFINATLTLELQTNEDFTLLFENSYYQFYKYHSHTLIRYEKQTGKSLVVGRFVNITECIQYHSKLYIAETRGTIGDRDIYQCNLNGANLISLQCLSNEKIFRAGHLVSMDSVKKMCIVNDSLEITVMRNDGSSVFDYKITISETNRGIEVKQRF